MDVQMVDIYMGDYEMGCTNGCMNSGQLYMGNKFIHGWEISVIC